MALCIEKSLPRRKLLIGADLAPVQSLVLLLVCVPLAEVGPELKVFGSLAKIVWFSKPEFWYYCLEPQQGVVMVKHQVQAEEVPVSHHQGL